MKTNVGSVDKVVRIALAILFAVLYFSGKVTGTLGIVLLVLGGIFLVTSLVGFCPIYAVTGLSTCPAKK
jgi:hypothetical protein